MLVKIGESAGFGRRILGFCVAVFGACVRGEGGFVLGCGEVVLYSGCQGLGYLLLAGVCAVGEAQGFFVVGDKDGFGYGRWHVALEEDARGEGVGRSRGYLSRAAGRGRVERESKTVVASALSLRHLPKRVVV